MHGQVKRKTTAALEAERKAKVAEQIAHYRAALARVMEHRARADRTTEALAATTTVLNANVDLYFIWGYRRDVLDELLRSASEAERVALFASEASFSQDCLARSPKSYWVWLHRHWLTHHALAATDWARELKLCGKMLDVDERNFHCWTYRMAVARACAASPDAELAHTTARINANFSNYSAWHYRSVLLRQTAASAAVLAAEFGLVTNAVFTEPADQSAWLYHRWLLGRIDRPVRLVAVCFVAGVGLALCFSHAVSGVRGAALAEHDDDAAWLPVGAAAAHSTASHVWLLPCASAPARLAIAGDVVVDSSGRALAATHVAVPFRAPLHDATPAADSDLLQREIAACDELLSLEPDCKWALATRLALMRAAGAPADALLALLTRLGEIDRARAGYYADVASHVRLAGAVATAVAALPAEAAAAAEDGLSALHVPAGLQLTCLDASLCARLVALQRLCVAGQRLRSLAGAELLLALHELDARDNALADARPLAELPWLGLCDLRGNALRGLPDCTRMGARCSSPVRLRLPPDVAARVDRALLPLGCAVDADAV